jgi:hypothetical protein
MKDRRKTLRPDDSRMTSSHDFLCIRHPRIGFLINRDQFFASVYLQQIDPLSAQVGQSAYWGGTMDFRQESLLVYRLDERLGDLFGDEPHDGLKIALIADTRVFHPENRQAFEAVAEAVVPMVSRDMVAFRIGSQAEIRHIPLPEIRRIPPSLRDALFRQGILGCSFPDRNEAFFFIDIETILFGEGKPV